MAVIFPDEALITNLSIITNTYGAGGQAFVGLYTADIAPTAPSVLADFTTPTWPSYANLALGSPNAPLSIVSGQAVATYDPITFQPIEGDEGDLPTTVYGWFLEIDDGVNPPTVGMAERFASPFTFNSIEDSYSVTVTLRQGCPSE